MTDVVTVAASVIGLIAFFWLYGSIIVDICHWNTSDSLREGNYVQEYRLKRELDRQSVEFKRDIEKLRKKIKRLKKLERAMNFSSDLKKKLPDTKSLLNEGSNQ